ncbi:MAG TPA: hypothetical protein VGJ95_01690 [Pseudonocardiaceae bacterium]|jgi:hypothetical protein
MTDRDTGDFEGLPPDEATDQDEVGELEYTDPPDDWAAADRYGTTPREENEGEPLSLRLTEELPEDAQPDDEAQDTPLGEWLRLVDDGGPERRD